MSRFLGNTHASRPGFFFGHSLKNSRWKKLKLKLKKLKTQEFFAQNSKFRQIFRNLRRFSTKYNNFGIKSGQIVQKLKNLSKTQGKISQNLKFPANPLPCICRKIVQKKPGLFWDEINLSPYVRKSSAIWLLKKILGLLMGLCLCVS